MTMPSHISFSALKNWVFCPFYHKITYIDHIRGFLGNEYTAFGTAIHTICEKKLLKEEIKDPVAEFNSQFISELSKLPAEIELNTKLITDMGEQARTLIPVIEPSFYDTFEGCEIVSTEEQLMEEIDDTGILFKGYIDAVIKTPDGKYHIIDWKTCSWGWDARKRSDPMVTYQLTLYKIFFAQKHSLELDKIETHFALLKRTAKKDKVEIFRVTSGNKKMQNAKSILSKAIFNIKKENFIKDRRSCAKCDFHKTEHCP